MPPAIGIASNSFSSHSSWPKNLGCDRFFTCSESWPESTQVRPPSHVSGNSEHAKKHTRQHTADERTKHGNRRIPPVRAALPGNRKNCMRDARPKISCRIYGG